MSDIGHSDWCIVDSGLPDVEDCPPCQEYLAKEQAYWRREYDAIGRHEMEVAKTYREDMIAAGRGHLLR